MRRSAPGPDLQAFLKALASETRQAMLVLFATHETLTVNQVADEQLLAYRKSCARCED